MRILVTGANGMLGTTLVSALREAGHFVWATDIALSPPNYLDVRNSTDIRRGMTLPLYEAEIVIHLAAITSLEVAESDPDAAYRTNTLGTKNVALECRRAGVPLVYVSTAGVFDGEQEALYTEFDQPNPINFYGKTKFVGEEIVRHTSPEHYIVRCGWMMSGGQGHDHKFVSLILAQLVAGAHEIRAVNDKFGSPTYAPDFAAQLLDLIGTDRWGTYHMTSGERASRYDVARAIVELRGLAETVEVVGVPSSEFEDKYFAPRPRSEAMRNMVLELEGTNRMRDWRSCLAEYLTTWP